MRISELVRLFALVLALCAAASASAKDIVLSVGIPDTETTWTRYNAARNALTAHINGGGTVVEGDRLFAQYPSGIQEKLTLNFVGGQAVISVTGIFGRFSFQQAQTGSGGMCPSGGGGTWAVETGYWANWTVCSNGSCSAGSTWMSGGLIIIQADTMSMEGCSV